MGDPAVIIGPHNPRGCDGHHPVTVMDRARTFGSDRPFSVLR